MLILPEPPFPYLSSGDDKGTTSEGTGIKSGDAGQAHGSPPINVTCYWYAILRKLGVLRRVG